MLGIEPESLEFKNVRPNQAYSTSVCITNNADSSLEFTLRATSPRYSISPNRVRLEAGQSIVVTVRLFVSQANASSSAATKNDSLVLKCLYSEQRLPVSYSLFKRPAGGRGRSRSPSPAPMRRSKSPIRTPQRRLEDTQERSQHVSPPRDASDSVSSFMRSTTASRGRANSATSPIPSPPHSPTRHEYDHDTGDDFVPRSEYLRVCDALDLERRTFEQRSEKVMLVLEKKDCLIRDLRNQLSVAGVTGRGEFERQLQHPAGHNSSSGHGESHSAEMESMREKLFDQSEQIEVLISEISRLRNELAESSTIAAPAPRSPPIDHKATQMEGGDAAPTVGSTAEMASLQRRITEIEADLYAARFKSDAALKENEELKSRNSYLEGECEELSSQLQHALASLRRSEERSQEAGDTRRTDIKEMNETDVSTSVGPEVFSLYKERAERAEVENGIFRDHIARLERNITDTESRCMQLSDSLSEKDVVCSQLADKCAELEAISKVSGNGPKSDNPVEESSRSPDDARGLALAPDIDGEELKEANVWWSYVWHAMGQSDAARLEREHDSTLQLLLTSSDVGRVTESTSESLPVAPHSLNYYTDAITRLQRSINELKSTTSAQVVEIATARQNLLSNKLKHRNEMDGLREELELSRRELSKALAREKAHKGDKEIKVAELANTVRMLSGKSDAHAIAAAARQDLLAEQLTIHHLRADVEAYRSLLDAEQSRITSLRRDVETSKSLLDACGVVETVIHVPGVSAQKVIETFAGKVLKLERQLASSQEGFAKLKLKIGDGFAASEAPQIVPSRGERKKLPKGLLKKSSASRSEESTKHGRGRSMSPTSTRAGLRRSKSLERKQSDMIDTEYVSGAESRVRSNLGVDNDSDDDVHAPPTLDVNSSGGQNGDPGHLWEALAPCIQKQTSESVVESLNSAIMARRLLLQADRINDLENKVEFLETERTEILQEKMKQEVDENDRTRIDLDTCYRRLELSESTQKLALEDLNRARARIVELEKDAVNSRIFGSGTGKTEVEHGSATKPIRYYDYMTDSDSDHDDGNKNGSETSSVDENENILNMHKRPDGNCTSKQSKKLAQRLKICEKDLSQSKDLLRERTMQLKILMQTVEAVQSCSVSSTISHDNVHLGNVDAEFDLEDLAKAPLNNIGQVQESTGNPKGLTGVNGFEALVKRVVELTTELSSQTAATSLLEQRLNELEMEKRKTASRHNALKANALSMSSEVARYAAENKSMKDRIRDIEFAALEKGSRDEKQTEKVLTALRESEAEVEALKITIENLGKQIDATDHRAFMRWMEDVVLNDDHVVPVVHSPSKRKAANAPDEDIDTGREGVDHGRGETTPEGGNSVKGLIISLLVQWREQAGFYPRGATGPITKAEQRFLQRISDLVLSSHERCERALVNVRELNEEKLVQEQKYTLIKTKLSLCTQQLHRYLRRTDFSERVISIERKHVIRTNERLLSLYRDNHVDVLETTRNLRRDLHVERSKWANERVEKCILSNKCQQLQCRVAELETQVSGTTSVKVREQVSVAVQHRVQAFEDTLHKWFKSELPRLLSGMPINEDDINMRNMYTDGDVLMYPLFSSVAASSDYIVHNQSKSYAMAQALCSSKAIQAAAELRASGLSERNSVLKDRIIELEGVIMRWRNQIDNISPPAPSSLLQGQSGNHGAEQPFENIDYVGVLNNLAEMRSKYLEAEERGTKLSSQLDQCQERSEAMRKLAEHLRKEEREERTFTAHQLTQLRLSLEEQHANELKDLRMSYEAEKESLGRELAMVADAIRREVNEDSAREPTREPTRPSHTKSDYKISDGELPELKEKDMIERQLDDDINRRKEELLQSLNAGISSTSAPLPPPPHHDDSVEHDTSSLLSTDIGESIASQKGKHDKAPSVATKRREKKSASSDVVSQKLAETTRQLALLQRSYETAQHQIVELEHLLETQRATFQLNRSQDQNYSQLRQNGSPRNNDTSCHDSTADAKPTKLHAAGPNKLTPTIDSLASEMADRIKALQHRHYSWMQALETASYIRSGTEAAESVLGSTADSAMIASEFASQIRILITLTDKLKLISENKTDVDPVSPAQPGMYPIDGAGNVRDELHHLIGRVKEVENILIEDRSMPEQHLLALRELRARCSGMENLYNEELSELKREWWEERETLNRQIQQLDSALACEREESSKQATILRERYETALNEVQESMELQTSSAGEQMSQLQDLLNSERSKFAQAMEERQRQIESETARDNGEAEKAVVDELAELKKLLGTANSELQESRAKLQGLENSHSAEMDNLREHFRKYRAAQQEVVSALEAQLNELTLGDNDLEDLSDLGADNTYVSYNQEFGANTTPQDAQLQMNKLAAKHRLRRLELNAILKAISTAGASVASDQSSAISLPSINIPTSISGGQNLHPNSNAKDADGWSVGAVTRIVPLREELLEARVTAADKELESLHEALDRERRANVNLREKVQDFDAVASEKHGAADKDGKITHDAEFSLPASFVNTLNENDKKVVSSFVRRVNNFKRSTKKQIMQLKNDLESAREDRNKEDIGKIKSHLSDVKSELNSLREDNARKSKLLATFKATRSADFNAIEQWRHEASDMEEKIKHMKVSITSKDSVIKDLRNKLSAVESSASDPTLDDAEDGDFSSLSAAQLKNRLKSSALEIKRCKMRLAAFREKVVDLERVVEPLKAENQKLAQIAEKVESLKNAIARKDSLLKNYKEQAERSKADFDALKDISEARRLDMDKKNKSLQRQLQDTQESIQLLQQESRLTKSRLLSAAEHASRGSKSDSLSRGVTPSSVPVGGLIQDHEAATQTRQGSMSRPRPSPKGGSGYLATTVSHSKKNRFVKESSGSPSSDQSQQQSSQGMASEVIDKQFHSLRQEEVPSSVDIPLSDLNDILEAVGGMTGDRNDHNHSSSSSGMFDITPPPGSGPARSSFLHTGADSSSESSSMSIERRLQQLVDSALVPAPPAPRSLSEQTRSDSAMYAGDAKNGGTRMSAKRNSTSNL